MERNTFLRIGNYPVTQMYLWFAVEQDIRAFRGPVFPSFLFYISMVLLLRHRSKASLKSKYQSRFVGESDAGAHVLKRLSVLRKSIWLCQYLYEKSEIKGMHAAHTPLYKCRPCSFLVQTTYKVDPTVPHEPKLVDHIISLLQLLESICTVSWPEMFLITCMHVKFSEFSP